MLIFLHFLHNVYGTNVERIPQCERNKTTESSNWVKRNQNKHLHEQVHPQQITPDNRKNLFIFYPNGMVLYLAHFTQFKND